MDKYVKNGLLTAFSTTSDSNVQETTAELRLQVYSIQMVQDKKRCQTRLCNFTISVQYTGWNCCERNFGRVWRRNHIIRKKNYKRKIYRWHYSSDQICGKATWTFSFGKSRFLRRIKWHSVSTFLSASSLVPYLVLYTWPKANVLNNSFIDMLKLTRNPVLHIPLVQQRNWILNSILNPKFLGTRSQDDHPSGQATASWNRPILRRQKSVDFLKDMFAWQNKQREGNIETQRERGGRERDEYSQIGM